MSAGRMYDKLGRKAKGKVMFVIPGGAICKITKNGLDDRKEEKLGATEERTPEE